MTWSRRTFLAGLGALAGLSVTNISFARGGGDRRFVLVILRGGLDGVHAIVPHGDPDYRQARGAMALPEVGGPDGVVDLDGFFGLHPAMEALKPWWTRGDLAAVHAVATPYRSRSHFDAQDILENGTDRAGGRDGWLDRALAALDASPEHALAIGRDLPLVLRGDQGTSSLDPFHDLRTTKPFLDEVAALYAEDPALRQALSAGVQTREKVDDLLDDPMMRGGRGRPRPAEAARATGKLMAEPDGPRVAVMELGGWDTHARQGGGLDNLLGQLAEGLLALEEALGDHWSQTAVVVCTEFGRTVKANGTGGTDHGTGSVALVAGGSVKGGQVLGDWPGLGAKHLFEGRDLRPTTDLRSVFKGVLQAHLGVERAALEDTVFPGSRGAPPLTELVG